MKVRNVLNCFELCCISDNGDDNHAIDNDDYVDDVNDDYEEDRHHQVSSRQ